MASNDDIFDKNYKPSATALFGLIKEFDPNAKNISITNYMKNDGLNDRQKEELAINNLHMACVERSVHNELRRRHEALALYNKQILEENKDRFETIIELQRENTKLSEEVEALNAKVLALQNK